MADRTFYLKSMTAYGRSSLEFPYGRFEMEIQSVNRRYLEINISLPKLLMRFEMEMRNQIGKLIGRGMINVSLYWKNEMSGHLSVVPNLALARSVKNAWEALALGLGMDPKIDLSLLAREKEMLIYEEELKEESVYLNALQKSLAMALSQLMEMKEKEGKRLALDFYLRTEGLKKAIQKIETFAPLAVEKQKNKLKERVETFFSGREDNEEKILREIALFSERVDITEEIVRFKSHLDNFQEMLEKPLVDAIETRGKTLDFLIQEMNREINTIGAKAAEKEVINTVISVKSELEKMREQVQNIE